MINHQRDSYFLNISVHLHGIVGVVNTFTCFQLSFVNISLCMLGAYLH